MTYNLTITDEHGRVVMHGKVEEDVRIDKDEARHRDEDFFYDYDDYRIGRGYYPTNNKKYNLVVTAVPMRDGSHFKMYKHKALDKLAGE